MKTPRTLAAQAVCFAYEAGAPVLKNVNMAVSGGSLTGIVGPNGSGKSTLLRLLCGLLAPRTGSVTLDGKPLDAFTARARARTLAFLPQQVQPVFSMTVFEVVCLGRYPHLRALGGLGDADIAAVQRAMHDTDTEAFADRDFLSLSGGERQRVLLAGVLAQEPDLLLLDEPTAALDIHHEAEVFARLAGFARAGYGIAVVTHDLNLAARFCDRLVLLSRDHEVIVAGAPECVCTAEHLSAAYGAPVQVGVNPFTGTPLIHAEQPEAGL